jgi:hypothetical protein
MEEEEEEEQQHHERTFRRATQVKRPSERN